MHSLHFTLPAKAPFRLDLTVWALKRRDRNIVDYWDGTVYIRVFILENIPIKVEVMQKDKTARIDVIAKANRPISKLKTALSSILDQMLGLKVDLKCFYAQTKEIKELRPLVLKFKGVKPPRFPSLFETLANAIAFQQLSLEAGFSILNNLTKKYGRSFKEKEFTFYAFPEARTIMKCTIKDLLSLGFSRNKSAVLIELASLCIKHQDFFDQLKELSDQETINSLCSLKGIGRWSAEYVLLRGLGRTAILPGDDVAIHKSLKNLLGLRKNVDYDKVKSIEKKWHPFAGLIYFHLLLERLSHLINMEMPVPRRAKAKMRRIV